MFGPLLPWFGSCVGPLVRSPCVWLSDCRHCLVCSSSSAGLQCLDCVMYVDCVMCDVCKAVAKLESALQAAAAQKCVDTAKSLVLLCMQLEGATHSITHVPRMPSTGGKRYGCCWMGRSCVKNYGSDAVASCWTWPCTFLCTLWATSALHCGACRLTEDEQQQ